MVEDEIPDDEKHLLELCSNITSVVKNFFYDLYLSFEWPQKRANAFPGLDARVKKQEKINQRADAKREKHIKKRGRESSALLRPAPQLHEDQIFGWNPEQNMNLGPGMNPKRNKKGKIIHFNDPGQHDADVVEQSATIVCQDFNDRMVRVHESVHEELQDAVTVHNIFFIILFLTNAKQD